MYGSQVTFLKSVMTEAVSTFETSVNFYETIRRNISEDIILKTRYGFLFGIPLESRICLYIRPSIHPLIPLQTLIL
jgi:hypothetical protein